MKNFTLGACILSAALASSAFGKPIYLKADATTGKGDGSSWANAYTAVTDAIIALNESQDAQPTLYVAQGLYAISSAQDITAVGAVIKGGYLGLSDGDMTRDVEQYQTIFSTDFDWNDCIRPAKASDTTYAQVVYNGIGILDSNRHIYLPPTKTDKWDCGERGFYMLFNQSGKSDVNYILKFAKPVTLSGVCFYGLNKNKGACLVVDAEAGGTAIDNCLFAYGSEAYAINASAPIRLIDSRFENNYTHWVPVVALASDSMVSNCIFRGNSGSTANTGNVLTFGGKGNLVKDCLFERCNAWVSGGFTKAANICYASSSGGGSFVDCVVTNCLSGPGAASVTANHSLFTLLGGGAATNCTFVGNRTAVYAVANGGYGLIAALYTGAHTFEASGCLFRDNVVSATPKTTESCQYVMGVIGNGFDGQSTVVKNCIFDGNEFEWTVAEGVTPILSRSAFTLATAANSTSKLTFVNNTVTGVRQASAYDIVQLGSGHKQALAVWNSIFTSDEWIHSGLFYADQPTLWDVRNCTAKNMTSAYWPQDMDVSSGFSSDDIPLAADYTPAARTPGIRNTTDGSVRGAVNALTDEAESGFTLTVRAEPVSSALISTPATQVVQPGGSTVPVTAEGVGGASMLGWYDTSDNLITAEATLPAQALSADLTVVAKFGVPKITFTFDLGECGTFAESGESTATVKAGAGEAFPGVPAHAIDSENWVFRGWFPEVPTVTPSEAVTFKAVYVTKKLRQIRVVPSHGEEPPEKEDGESWETAYTDLAAAYRDAATYQGEVWLKAGTYAPAASIPMLSRVRVIGGFAGGETSADEADPEANDTIITIQGAAFYADSGTVEDAKFFGLHFKDVKNSAIRVNGATVTGLEIEKCIFERCNAAKASDFGPVGVKACAVTLRDCLFTNSYHCAYFANTTDETPATVDGCRFIGNDGQNYGTCVYIDGKGTLTVRDSSFESNTNTTHNCSGSATITLSSSSAKHLVSGCTFKRNVVGGTCQANVLVANGSATIEGCSFEGNILTGCHNSGTSHSATIHTGSWRTTVKDCYFGQNVVSTPATSSYRSVFYIGANQVICLNCTFDRNVVERAEGDTGVTTLMQFFGHNQGIALAHCTIAGTVLPTGCAEIDCRGTDTTSYQNCALSFVNTILWNDAVDYNPVNVAGKDIPLWVQNSVVKNMNTDQYVKRVVCTNLLTNVDPKLASEPKSGENDICALPLHGDTPVRKFGCRTWYDSKTGLAYAYNPASKNYLCLSKASTTGLPSGLTADDPPPADVWGRDRAPRKIALGALNTEPLGLMLLVR